MIIQPVVFYDLLDCLTGQFFTNKSAFCTKSDFGPRMIAEAKDYFSIAVIPEKLPKDRVVLGVLLDDSVYIGGKRGYTLTIYIDISQIEDKAFKIFSSIILAHEICHFAFYYELFIGLGGTAGIVEHSKFTHTVCGKLEGAIIKEADTTSQTIFDEHNIMELVKNLGSYPKSHFSKKSETKIHYNEMFMSFLVKLLCIDELKT